MPRHGNFADRSLLKTADIFYGYADPSLDDGSARLAEAGSYEPNPWGLHDVYGNVWEWTETPYHRQLRGGVDPFDVDRKGADGMVVRGGSWCSLPEYCRSAFRHRFGDREQPNFLGYRLVLRRKRP